MKKQFGIKAVVALMAIASALTCVSMLALGGLYTGFGSWLFDEVRTYVALRRVMDASYIGEYDGQRVSQAALSAAVDAIDDRWSFYLSPEEYKKYTEASDNVYAGIGISVQADEKTGGLLITGVYPGSPAEEAGLVAGDAITAIDGEDITQLPLQDAAARVDRELGQTALLTVTGPDGAQREVAVAFTLIETPPVGFEMLDGDVGYIRIENFEGGCADGFIGAADALVDGGARSFIFDVRNNGGGRVSELAAILDYLLPECEIFISVDRGGGEDVLWSGPENVALPAVVLVNGYSYSAAEYFAACLSEYDYARVVGQRTTGKSRSQITVPLPDGGALHISSGEYLTPNRVSLSEQEGFEPDYISVLSDEDNALLYLGELDPSGDIQLQKALELLR